MTSTQSIDLNNLQIYLVGGAVRDRLLCQAITENDWVVVGATPEQLLQLGFKPIGKDFPVFLHPQTHEEYALARTERKTAPGYKGFVFHAAPDVTLAEDLQRRDLTINAIAMTQEGKFIDPYHGQRDLNDKILRHVSDAFVEDPVRILRVARFMARFAHLGFTIAPETQQFMQQMVANGEVDALVPERVWQEFDRALAEAQPLVFFQVLKDCGALAKLFPEYLQHIDELRVSENSNKMIRFAQLCLPLSLNELDEFNRRSRIPHDYYLLAQRAIRLQKSLAANTLSAEAVLNILDSIDVWRQPDNLAALSQVFEESLCIDTINKAYQHAKKITAAAGLAQGLQGKALGEAIARERLQMITALLSQRHEN